MMETADAGEQIDETELRLSPRHADKNTPRRGLNLDESKPNQERRHFPKSPNQLSGIQRLTRTSPGTSPSASKITSVFDSPSRSAGSVTVSRPAGRS